MSKAVQEAIDDPETSPAVRNAMKRFYARLRIRRLEETLGDIGDQLDSILEKYQMPKTMPIGWTDVDYERVADWVEPMRREIETLREKAHAACVGQESNTRRIARSEWNPSGRAEATDEKGHTYARHPNGHWSYRAPSGGLWSPVEEQDVPQIFRDAVRRLGRNQ